MSPAKSLAGLLNEGSLERIPVDAATCSQLLKQASNHLRTAAAGLAGGDSEGAFQLAYDACRKTCLALVLATGLRPAGTASHVITFLAAGAIAERFSGSTLVREAGELRYVRHSAQYRAEAISTDDAQDSIELGDELLTLMESNVARILST